MSNPAIFVPAGLTTSGLPLGIQIVGPHNSDLSLLQVAYAFEPGDSVRERASNSHRRLMRARASEELQLRARIGRARGTPRGTENERLNKPGSSA
jgi:Asp-tRNA(Asn)/Glu-tRNA(Gln) amidotransferase A subunit family amidase